MVMGGRGFYAGARHIVELAVELGDVLGPDRVETAEELVGAPAAVLEGHADRLVLVLRPADAEPHVETAAREHVQRGELLGEDDRLVEGHDQHAGAEADALGGRGHVGERDDGIEDALEGLRPYLARRRRVLVLGLERVEQALEHPERMVAERFRLARHANLVLGGGPVPGGGQREPELHGAR